MSNTTQTVDVTAGPCVHPWCKETHAPQDIEADGGVYHRGEAIDVPGIGHFSLAAVDAEPPSICLNDEEWTPDQAEKVANDLSRVIAHLAALGRMRPGHVDLPARREPADSSPATAGQVS